MAIKRTETLKITVQRSERKLMALISITRKGMFLRLEGDPDKCIYVRDDGKGCEVCNYSLEKILAESKERTPIYEGDSIHIQF